MPERTPRFLPPLRPDGRSRDRRFALVLSIALHLILLAVLSITDVVRLPNLASLLDEPPAGGAAERVVYMPIDGFPGPRTSASPSPGTGSVPAPLAAPLVPSGVADPAGPAGPAGPIPAPAPGSGGAGADAAAGSGGAAMEGGGTTASDRFNRAVAALRPRSLSPLLRGGTLDGVRTDEERAALRAYGRIRALNDSIMAEAEAGRRATDWTWTDEQGRRWGISPGKLHLGGITIPLPVTTASREDRDLMREWQEIQAQAERGAIDETFDERIEAIRAQRDAERSEE